MSKEFSNLPCTEHQTFDSSYIKAFVHIGLNVMREWGTWCGSTAIKCISRIFSEIQESISHGYVL